LSRIYLVRHGQAGTREAYDSLSERGREQSRFLGEHLAAQDIPFTAAYTGAMLRQQQTAEELSRGYTQAGGHFPAIIVDEDWNEFDLSGVIGSLRRCSRPQIPTSAASMLPCASRSAKIRPQRMRPCTANGCPVTPNWSTPGSPAASPSPAKAGMNSCAASPAAATNYNQRRIRTTSLS
jgi:hypothetical protein